jgi:predicted SAM-dependent methyltransferase
MKTLDVFSIEKLTLDIGCGNKKRPCSIGIDIKRSKGIDIIADARFLPLKDECISYVYSSHLIEHISHRETESALTEWVRVLQINNPIEIRCPDFRASCLRFFVRPSWTDERGIFGMQTDESQYHKSGFSYGLLKIILNNLGIQKVKRLRDWSGLFPWIDLHIRGEKVTKN